MKFKVNICRIGYSHKEIEVEAENEEQAKEKALDTAGNFEFSENHADYEAGEVYKNEK